MHKITLKTIREAKAKNREYYIQDSEIRGLALRVYPTGAKVWYLNYTARNGKRRRYKIGEAPAILPDTAREVAEKRRGEIADGKDPQQIVKHERKEAERRKRSTVGAFLDEKYWPDYLASLKTGDGTRNRIRSVWGNLLKRQLDSITAREIDEHKARRQRDGIKPTTINRDMAALQGLFSKAVRWGYVDLSPFARVDRCKVNNAPKIRYLGDADHNQDERERLISALDEREKEMHEQRQSANEWRRERGYEEHPPLGWFADHLKPIVLLALNTGMRRGEIFSLEWSDVNFNEARVRVADSKSGHSRTVQMNKSVGDLLKKWRAQTSGKGLVFPGKNGNRLDNITSAWRALMKRAQIEGFRFHDLRHDFASRLVSNGVSLNTVRELLGHSDMKMTLRYAHLAPDAGRAAVAILDQIAK